MRNPIPFLPRWWPTVVVTLAVLGLGRLASACSVPVFRYALERWPADYYQVVVFHRGKLPAEQNKIVDLLSEEGWAGQIHANVFAVTCDLDGKVPEELGKLWEQQKDKAKKLPWMVIRYPWQTRIPVPVWTGPLDEKVIRSLVNSPARKEIAKRILAGDSAVWLLLECGNKKKDDAAYKLLKKQIDLLHKELQMPEIDPEDVARGYISGDPSALKIKFSILRVSRKDPAEKMFVELLLGTEPDLREFDEPMVFPIFGRGRVLFALVGKGINEDTIGEAAFILTGPCTCTIKAQNPGTDLVMAVDWDAKLEEQFQAAIEQMQIAELSGLGGLTDAKATSDEGDEKAEAPLTTVAATESEKAMESLPETASILPGASDSQEGVRLPQKSPTAATESESDAPAIAAVERATQQPPAAETAHQPAPPAAAEPAAGGEAVPLDPMVRNVLILAAIAVIGVIAGSFFIVKKSGAGT